MKGYQFLYGPQPKNDQSNNLITSKLNKDLSKIECFQCLLSIENSNSVFTLKLNDCAEWKESTGQN